MRLALFFILLLLSACSLNPPVDTVQKAVAYYAPRADQRLAPDFEQARVTYPPAQVSLLVFKQEKKLELWTRARFDRPWVLIKTYPILAASGDLGPKLREGDRQVPEGIYRIVGLNQHSHYHLSMILDYPNKFDRIEARQDRRRHLGSSICIHGNAVSIGCIAVGNEAIEELFILVYQVGLNHVQVIIAPNDLRTQPPIMKHSHRPRWLPILYLHIKEALQPFQMRSPN